MADDRRARELDAMAAASDAQLRSAAIREMRAVMMRLAKGEVAMFLEMWRTKKKLAWMEQADALRARLEAEMKAGQQSGALRQLHLVFAGIMKGEKAVALQAMRMRQAQNKQNHGLAQMQAESEAQLRSAQ